MPKSKALTLIGSEFSASSKSISSRLVSTGGAGVLCLPIFGGKVSGPRLESTSDTWVEAWDKLISFVSEATNCLIASSFAKLSVGFGLHSYRWLMFNYFGFVEICSMAPVLSFITSNNSQSWSVAIFKRLRITFFVFLSRLSFCCGCFFFISAIFNSAFLKVGCGNSLKLLAALENTDS